MTKTRRLSQAVDVLANENPCVVVANPGGHPGENPGEETTGGLGRTANGLTVEVMRDNKDLLFVARLRDQGFTQEEIGDVIATMDSVCHACWDAEDGCQCWNHE